MPQNSGTKRATPSPRVSRPTKPKPRIERDAVYTVAELHELTGMGTHTLYALLRAEDGRRRRRLYVTGADFLARLSAA